MLTIYKEIACDYCKDSNYYHGTKEQLEKDFEESGGLIFDGKHFCNAGCYADYCKDAQQKESEVDK